VSLTHPSPNHNDRKGQTVKVIVLHADASPTEKGCLSWLQSSESKVSYHALVGRDGKVYTVVPYDRRAWHAGKAEWNGHKDVNGVSVGLCFSNRNDGKEPLTDAQRKAMQTLIADVRRKYGTLPVTTHAKVSPGRKTDPEHVPGFVLADYE
jgi:N-acetylmuramoyl-L-alanine amidase